VRGAATLIELLMVLVIISLLSVGSFKALQKLKVREYKAKEQTRLSLESQITVDIISNYLKYRIPYTTIGYNPTDGSFEYIGNLSDNNKRILEWFGRDRDALYDQSPTYSGFFDMASKSGDTVFSPDTNLSETNERVYNLIFAGSFDRAYSGHDYNSSFGWHNNDSNESFDVTLDGSGNITFSDATKPKFLYEKYFLTKSAYAIARGVDINQDAQCIEDLNITKADINNTLLLFYDYQPWDRSSGKGETFCADRNGTNQAGEVTILMRNVSGFSFKDVDYTIRILLDINKSIRGANPVHFSKMKVVF
jgi:type II secretory pathway pseudopilin PulG